MNFLSNLKIGARLGAAFAVVLTLLTIMIFSAIVQAGRLQANTARYEVEVIPSLKVIQEIDHHMRDARRYESQYLLLHTDAEFKDFDNRISTARTRIDELLKSYSDLVGSEEDKRLYTAVLEETGKYWKEQEKILAATHKANGDQAQIDAVTQSLLNGDSSKIFNQLNRDASDWWTANEKIADAMGVQARETYSHAIWILSVLGVIAVAIGVVSAVVITRSITTPLNDAVAAAKLVAAGDLTGNIEVRSSDETGQLMQALSDMNQNLANTISQIHVATQTISTASGEIASGNADLSARTESQASSLEETASSMEELTSTVRQNADNARQANQLVISASDVASKGGTVVGQVVTTMGSIKDSSSKIVDIISVIDGIAFQTNILALNAAVEAARAGEQGRGFAVVATEVRNLAQRSASAAKEIKTLIDDSVEKVDHGSRLVDQAGQTMGEIVSSVRHVADIMSEITAASQEQSAGIEQVNLAITQMDEMTQQNAALVEQAAAAAESMQEQAVALSDTVGVFRVNSSSGHTRQHTASQHAAKKEKAPMKAAATYKKTAPPKRLAQSDTTAKPTPKATQTDTGDGWEEF